MIQCGYCQSGQIMSAAAMPAFGSTHSDTEIAAVSNYVTARFGSARSSIADKDVAQSDGPMM